MNTPITTGMFVGVEAGVFTCAVGAGRGRRLRNQRGESMSPLCIRTVLDVWTMGDHKGLNGEGIGQAKDAGLIETLPSKKRPNDYREYGLTPVGLAYVQILTAMPLPKPSWTIPEAFALKVFSFDEESNGQAKDRAMDVLMQNFDNLWPKGESDV